MKTVTISGHIVDVLAKRIFDGSLTIDQGRVAAIDEHPVSESSFILPGFVDAHIHIESSMMPPASFAQLAVRFGTVATVSDPHGNRQRPWRARHRVHALKRRAGAAEVPFRLPVVRAGHEF